MKKIDITEQILQMHEEETLLNMVNEAQQELKDHIPTELQSLLDSCLTQLKDNQQSNVVEFKPKSATNTMPFAQTELLAASGQLLADWFTQPINFGGAGFILDIRKVLGSNDEVDLYLKPNHITDTNMKNTLLAFLGQTINISILNNDISILKASLYIDEEGDSAEGSGYLLQMSNANGIKGKITIEIELDDQ